MSELTTTERGAVAEQSGNILAIIDKVSQTPTLTAEHVAVIERLVALQERQEAQRRKDAFNEAHRECVKEMPRVSKNGHVLTKTGGKIYSYARLEDLDACIRPVYEKFGFGVSFDAPMAIEGGKIRVTAIFSCGGHSEPREITASPSNRSAGNVTLTDIQKVKQTITEGRRHLLEMFFNIITEDGDAPPQEECISQDEADDIRTRMNDLRQAKPGAILAKLCAKYGVDVPENLRVSQIKSVMEDVVKAENMPGLKK